MPRPIRSGVIVLLLTVAVGLVGGTAPPDVLHVGPFARQDTSQAYPEDWRPISLAKVDRKTQYDLVKAGADSNTVVRARSDGGASGLATECRVDLSEYPILEWRWKVEGTVVDGNARTKDGDDLPARLYVTFDYDDLGVTDRIMLAALRAFGYEEIPTRALSYVWANRVDRGTILESPYTDWVRVVTVRSGERRTGTWTTERRNVLKDYRQAFGGDPPPVNGLVIMTDTDNTGGRATAYYGNIVFRRKGPSTSE